MAAPAPSSYLETLMGQGLDHPWSLCLVPLAHPTTLRSPTFSPPRSPPHSPGPPDPAPRGESPGASEGEREREAGHGEGEGVPAGSAVEGAEWMAWRGDWALLVGDKFHQRILALHPLPPWPPWPAHAYDDGDAAAASADSSPAVTGGGAPVTAADMDGAAAAVQVAGPAAAAAAAAMAGKDWTPRVVEVSAGWQDDRRFGPRGLAPGDAPGEVFMSDSWGCCVWRMILRLDGEQEPPERVAGTGLRGHRDGAAAFAALHLPAGLARLPGPRPALLIADHGNHCLRRLRLIQPGERRRRLGTALMRMRTAGLRPTWVLWRIAMDEVREPVEPLQVVLALAQGVHPRLGASSPLRAFAAAPQALRSMVRQLARALFWRSAPRHPAASSPPGTATATNHAAAATSGGDVESRRAGAGKGGPGKAGARRASGLVTASGGGGGGGGGKKEKGGRQAGRDGKEVPLEAVEVHEHQPGGDARASLEREAEGGGAAEEGELATLIREARLAFDRHDEDKSGTISPAELRNALAEAEILVTVEEAEVMMREFGVECAEIEFEAFARMTGMTQHELDRCRELGLDGR